jgi:hypothetical protein
MLLVFCFNSLTTELQRIKTISIKLLLKKVINLLLDRRAFCLPAMVYSPQHLRDQQLTRLDHFLYSLEPFQANDIIRENNKTLMVA